MAKKQSLDIYGLIGELCTAEQLRDLLRSHKQDNPKQVHVSGSKEEVLSAIRKAVSGNIVPAHEIESLLRESEENGDQHIFYFRPKSPETRRICRDGNLFAERLWGEDWGDTNFFPLLEYKADELTWVDFRIGLRAKQKDWIAKLYMEEGHDKLERQVRDTSGNLVQYFKRVGVRIVVAVRWNEPDLLEVRISRTKNAGHKAMQKRLTAIWAMLAPAFSVDDFTEWDLSSSQLNMVNSRSDSVDIYELSDVILLDSHSAEVKITPSTEEESFDDAQETGDAIDLIANAEGADCKYLAISWHPDESKLIMKDDFRTYVGGRNKHELIIPTRVSGTAVDYVTSKLREFS